MESIILKRYRVRPKEYLCMTPMEAKQTGITLGEQVIEEILLVRRPGPGAREFAAIRTGTDAQIRAIPPLDRQERLFPDKRSAMQFIAGQPPGSFELAAVKEMRTVTRDEMIDESGGAPGETPIDDISDELAAFDVRTRQK